MKIKVANPGVGGHPQLSVWVFTRPPPPKFFLEIKVGSPRVGGHAHLSHPPPHFFEMEVSNPRSSGHPQLSVSLVTPSPSFLFRNRSGSPGVGGHAQISFCFFTPPPPFFFEIDVPYPGICLHPQLSVCLSLHPPPHVLEIQVEVQQLLGTLSFLCALSPPAPMFLGNQSVKSIRCFAPLTSCLLPPPPGLFQHPLPITLAFVPPSFSFLNSL